MEARLWFQFIALSYMLKQHLVFANKICQTFKFSIDQDLVNDHALEGHVFRNSAVDRATQCHMMCKDDCRCVSMNYIHNTPRDICQLSDANRNTKPAAMSYRPGAKYYDMVRYYTIVSMATELLFLQ